MIHAVCFDTLAYANKLKSVGVSDKQAEVQAKALAEVFAGCILQPALRVANATKFCSRRIFEGRVAAKQDLEVLGSEMKHETETLRSEMNVKFAELKAEVIKWVVGISAAQGALIVSVLSILKFAHS